MDDLAALARANEEFARVVNAVNDDQWHIATACPEWDAAALVDHVNRGNRMAELLLHGTDAETATGALTRAPDGEAPAQTFTTTSAAQLAAFAEDGALVRVVHHPVMDMTGEQLLMFRTLDLALHGWDLATGITAATALDPDLAGSLWTRLEPIAELLSASGMFAAPQRPAAADLSAADALLRATGR